MPLVTALPTFGFGKVTATAGTVINRAVWPKRRAKTKIEKIVYTNSTTAHVLTVLRPIGTTLFAPAKNTTQNTAGQAVVVLASDPGNYTVVNPLTGIGCQPNTVFPTPVAGSIANQVIATTNIVMYELPNGACILDTVNGVPVVNGDGTVTVTLTTNLPTGGVSAPATAGIGVNLGFQGYGRFWLFGAITSIDPVTGDAHQTFSAAASVATTWMNEAGGSVIESASRYQPLIVQSNNITAAGTLSQVSGVYAPV